MSLYIYIYILKISNVRKSVENVCFILKTLRIKTINVTERFTTK